MLTLSSSLSTVMGAVLTGMVGVVGVSLVFVLPDVLVPLAGVSAEGVLAAVGVLAPDGELVAETLLAADELFEEEAFMFEEAFAVDDVSAPEAALAGEP